MIRVAAVNPGEGRGRAYESSRATSGRSAESAETSGGATSPAADSAEAEVLTAGPLEIYVDEGLARVDGKAIRISGHAFGILVALARRPGEIVSRDDLYLQAWGTPLRPGDRSVDVFMVKLRGLLETDRPSWSFIHTHPGLGYRLAPQPEGRPPSKLR